MKYQYQDDKGEACTRLAQLPCTSKRDTEYRIIADRHIILCMLDVGVGIVTSLRVKCRAHSAQVKGESERESS
jgi:hypothetical protein